MPFTDMQPTDPNDPRKRFMMYKAAPGGGGSDSNDGLTQATPLATFNEWWRRLFLYNLNGCWPWLNVMDGTHTDWLDACNQPPGAPGYDITNPGAGAGSFPNIQSINGPTNCILATPDRSAFSAINQACYVVSNLTFNMPANCPAISPGEYGEISGGGHVIQRCQYFINANGGKYIGDGSLIVKSGVTIGGLFLASERGEIKMVQGVPITFNGPVTVTGAVAFLTNYGYLRCPVSWVNKQFVTGRQYICQKDGGLETYTGTPLTFMPGTVVGVTHQAGIPDGWAF